MNSISVDYMNILLIGQTASTRYFKRPRNPIPRSTHVRAEKEFGRMFVDPSGSKQVESKSGNQYVLIARDDFSMFMWVHAPHEP